ncbi:phosphate propanoyltransferase [Tissierella sp. MSJ-40]|uniref:Phosphate propanoyltransferase n=1 Tax=Tissierella simiarum TaxID=2841534 RepID=A0ABS6E3P4_9FIRM|nr:phosphate propanoyltransferase [Tissierella simiarum]MBU5437536.1 phosphate propanoyltransferase [Tissierella simiarum]
MNTSNEELISLITKLVIEEMNKKEEILIPIGVSNRHAHLSREDLDILFGTGYQLNKVKDLKQPGQYATDEFVTIKGPKGEIKNIRILGPLRNKTQIEVSITDGFQLGIKPPIRESGNLDDSCPIEIIGPKGSIRKSNGVIAALRHIHMSPGIAEKLNLKDKDIVDVEVPGIRRGILGNVLIRVSDKYELEMHIDTDESNAYNLRNNDKVKIV